MVVLDDIVFSLQPAGGISAVWAALIKGLQNYNADYRCLEFAGSHKNIFRQNVEIPETHLSYRSGCVGIKRYIDQRIKWNEPFIFHSSYYRICPSHYAVNVTTVHDFIYEKFVLGFNAKVHHWQKFRAICKSDAVVCISENTKRDLLQYLPNIDPAKIYVIYNGVSEAYRLIHNTREEWRDCVLFVGARDGYKNFDFVLHALAPLHYRLMVVGAPLTECERKKAENLLGRDRLIERGRLSDVSLNEAYNSVACLVYPSSYEGFGIPVLEAQRAGCPVIAISTSSIPEIIGETPLLLDNLSEEKFRQKLQIAMKQRDNIVKAGLDNSRRFSWEKMAAEYIALYKNLIK